MELKDVVHVQKVFGMCTPLGKSLRIPLESWCAPPEYQPAGAHAENNYQEIWATYREKTFFLKM